MNNYQESDAINATRWAELKALRNTLFIDADNLVNTALDKGVDVTLFRQYRQALRDIPQTFSDAQDVVWPTKPLLPQASA
jgi:hypothetical protein